MMHHHDLFFVFYKSRRWYFKGYKKTCLTFRVTSLATILAMLIKYFSPHYQLATRVCLKIKFLEFGGDFLGAHKELTKDCSTKKRSKMQVWKRNMIFEIVTTLDIKQCISKHEVQRTFFSHKQVVFKSLHKGFVYVVPTQASNSLAVLLLLHFRGF